MAKIVKKTKKIRTKLTSENSLDEVLNSINKKYGDGSLQYGDTSVVLQCESIPTGAITLDDALGIGGVPRGRIIELYGPESSGKTTLALHVVAEAQKLGGMAAFIDAEHALDKYWAKNLGVNTSQLVISQPDSGEQALDICESLISSEKFSVIVIDSVAALTPQAEIDGELGDSHIGAQARLISKSMRKLCSLVAKTNTCVIFINQIRMKIGVMFGNPEVTPGGKAIKFYAAVRIDVRKTTTLKDGNTPIGQEVRARIIKNKVAPPFEEAHYSIYFGKQEYPVYGIDSYSALLNLAVDMEIVNKSGAWFSYEESRLGQGASASANTLRERENGLAEKIEKDIRDVLKSKQVEPNNNPLAENDEMAVDDMGFDEVETESERKDDTTTT